MQSNESDSFRLTYSLHDQTKTAEFDQPRVLIGRGSDCDLVLLVADVSRRHAVIERDKGGWMLSDLGSTYGTFVRGERITRYRLEQGDHIIFGLEGTRATFHLTPQPTGKKSCVLFNDTSEQGDVRLTLSVEEFERRMGGRREPEETVASETETHVPPRPLPSDLSPFPEGISIVGLFQQVGEVLLRSQSLDEMLASVVDIALANLPAQRGFICLCDDAAETITPKTARSKGESQNESISISRSIAREAVRNRQALLVTDVPADDRFSTARSVKLMDIRAAMCAPLYHAGQVEGLIYVDALGTDVQFAARDLELLTALGVLTAVGMLQARLREDIDRERAIRTRLSRYSSPHVVEQIAKNIDTPDGAMHAELREVSILFADLSDFTSMAENMQPAEVARVLNSLFEHLTRAVFNYDGTLDKYLGDGLLAVFGAPLPQEDHAERAVRAALLMQHMLDENRIAGPRGEPLRMRVGINSGTAVVGDIGSPIRKDFTVIGDAVNVASRLESSVAQPGQIVIGPDTYELCKTEFCCRPLPGIRLKGKQQLVCPYLIVRS